MLRRLLTAVILPYTFTLSGLADYNPRTGVPSCLSFAEQELRVQRDLVKRLCARDGGRIKEKDPIPTMVQNVHCSWTQTISCLAPDEDATKAPSVPDGPRS